MDLYCAILIFMYQKNSDCCDYISTDFFRKMTKMCKKLTKAETRDKERCILILYNEFHQKYNYRDDIARKKMRELVNSDANKVINVFSTLT